MDQHARSRLHYPSVGLGLSIVSPSALDALVQQGWSRPMQLVPHDACPSKWLHLRSPSNLLQISDKSTRPYSSGNSNGRFRVFPPQLWICLTLLWIREAPRIFYSNRYTKLERAFHLLHSAVSRLPPTFTQHALPD